MAVATHETLGFGVAVLVPGGPKHAHALGTFLGMF